MRVRSVVTCPGPGPIYILFCLGLIRWDCVAFVGDEREGGQVREYNTKEQYLEELVNGVPVRERVVDEEDQLLHR